MPRSSTWRATGASTMAPAAISATQTQIHSHHRLDRVALCIHPQNFVNTAGRIYEVLRMDAEGYAIKTMVAVDLRLGGADGGRRHGGCASSAPSGGARHFEICSQQLFPDARREAAGRIWRNVYRRSNCL